MIPHYIFATIAMMIEPPSMSPWPDGLPPPEIDGSGNLVMKPELAEAVAKALVEGWACPSRCAARLDWAADLCQAAVKESTRLATERCQMVFQTPSADSAAWKWWEVGLVGLGAFGTGVGIGFLLSILTR